MSRALRYGVRSDIGHVREGNEDAGYAGPRLVAVADGMGGAVAGEVASRTVIGRLAGLEDDSGAPDVVGSLSAAVRAANGDLSALVRHDQRLAGMGTTVTAMLADDDRLALVHVGDSRCYLLREHVLTQVTHDHTLVQELVDAGEISEDEAAVHPKRNIITRVLDGRDRLELDVSVRPGQLGDRYLLCSDGLSGYVDHEAMADALELPDPQAAADRLVELALRAGGIDNVTAVVADVVEGDSDAAPTLAGAAADEAEPAGDEIVVSGAPMVRQARGLGLGRRSQPAVAGGRTRSRWLVPGIGMTVLLLVVVALLGGWLYVRSQWYVGPDHDHVALFRGVPGSIGPLTLSSVVQVGPALATLTPELRRQVSQRIDADSRGAAVRILEEVESNTLPTSGDGLDQTATPSPSSTPTTVPS